MDPVIARLCKRVKEMRDSVISRNAYCQQLLSVIKSTFSVGQIVCYGLGPICRSIVSQHQLAVLSWLSLVLTVKVYCYDPCFDKDDLLVLEWFDIELCEYPRYPNIGTARTLIFMPHCERDVYCELLAVCDLELICLFGNDLRRHTDSIKSSVRIPDDEYIRSDVFNDCHLHLFTHNSIPITAPEE